MYYCENLAFQKFFIAQQVGKTKGGDITSLDYSHILSNM